MALVAIETDGDKELTDKVFKVMNEQQAKHNRKLERIAKIPTEGTKKTVFLENIEGYRHRKNTFRWLAKSRPYENIVFYTCKNHGTIPKDIKMITDFYFLPLLSHYDGKDRIRIMIFSQGDWLDKIDMSRWYMKSMIATIKKGKISIRNRKEYGSEA